MWEFSQIIPVTILSRITERRKFLFNILMNIIHILYENSQYDPVSYQVTIKIPDLQWQVQSHTKQHRTEEAKRQASKRKS